MKILVRTILIITGILIALSITLFQTVERSPYKEQSFYSQTSEKLSQLEKSNIPLVSGESVRIGWSRVNITPEEQMPLAGYGARDPMIFEEVHDSVFISSYVIDNSTSKKAIITADLLIIHPEVRNAFYELLLTTQWKPEDVFLTASHTHSSLGAWGPGFVGGLFAGDYDPEVVQYLAEKIFDALQNAENALSKGSFGYAAMSIPDLVKNRLIRNGGEKDPWAKMLFFQSASQMALHMSYSAHATCLSYNSTDLSGDYPSAFVSTIENQKAFDFASYGAGAVASMGPADTQTGEWEKANEIGTRLAENVSIIRTMGIPMQDSVSLRSFQLPLSLREPQFKISRDICLRPWVFEEIFGEYSAVISLLQVNNVLLVGLPGDFSGELALPLYEYAQSKGLQLIINSFNGGYIGYIPKDEWYDKEKYETRTMAWYGHDNGAYMSELIRSIIDICSK